MENWYVAQTKFARKSGRNNSCRVRGDVPAADALRGPPAQWQGQGVTPQPMFPNYIFVRFDPEVVHTTAIKATRGISTLISFGGLPSVVPDSVITQLSQGWSSAPPETVAPQHGDRVMLRDGAFEGIEAVWYEPDGMKRAMLLLNLMNQQVRVPVNSSMRFHIVAREAAA
jgi:transcriptional antiterminator RfaH